MSSGFNCYLSQVKLTVDGYEHGPCGKHWGVGKPLYKMDIKMADFWKTAHLRADDREDAKKKVLKQYPKALFFI